MMMEEATPTNAAAASAAAPAPSGRGRRRGHGCGRKQNKSLRTPVTFAHKLAVIDFYDQHDKDIHATMQQFYATLPASAQASRKRQIYKWVKDRPAIEEMCFKKSTAAQTRRRDKGTATTLSDAAEQELLGWIRQVHVENAEKMSAQTFREMAMAIADKYDVPKGSFQATWTWQQGFFKRHQVTSLQQIH